MTTDELRAMVMGQAQGAAALNLAFVGVANGLFAALAEPRSVDELAEHSGLDLGYLRRWCEASFAFGTLSHESGRFFVTELGALFDPATPGSMMALPAQVVLGGHMMERAAGLMRTGERPGERVLGERPTILPLFGPMLEQGFTPLMEREVLPRLGFLEEVGARGGLVIDLGCGNGWALRVLARRFPGLRGVGLDGFGENIRQATARAEAAGLGDRLRFVEGELSTFRPDEPIDALFMSRALHHVWPDAHAVLGQLRDALRPGGHVILWEPAWPDELSALRDPRRRVLAFQNLSEHIQGNHFLRPAEIVAAVEAVGLKAEAHLFAEGAEVIVLGVKA